MARVRGLIGALLAFAWIAPLGAQTPTGTIRGRILDASTQEPLSAVSITFGTRGALTQTDGRFVMAGVPASTDTLRARIVGYAMATQSVTVAGGDTVEVNLTMTRQAIGLSEIVVTGYGEQRLGNVTGAVSQLDSTNFNTGRIVSPQQLIASKVAGVQVVDNNEPGGGLSVRIRGATSVNASSDPLYVVDGMPVSTGSGAGISAGRDALNFLNPNDVQSITVLKDASAAAIYGANAANGVVIINTKTGRGGPQIQYSGSASSSSVTRLPQMLNAAQFRTAVLATGDTALINQLGTANTDWFSLIDRTAFGQQHDVVISGVGQSNDYHLSVGYLNQDGIIGGSNTQRVSLGFTYQQRLLNDRLSVRTNLKGSRAFDRFTPGGVLSNAAQMGPTQPAFDQNSPTGYYNWPGNKLQSADNPLQILNLARAQGTTYRSVGNLQAAYSLPFVEGLKANMNIGYDVTNVSQVTFNPSTLHSEQKSGQNGYFYRTDPNMANTVLETYLNLARPLNFAPGTIDATAGYSYTQSHAEYPTLTLTGLSTNVFDINGFPTALNTSPGGPNIQESKLISFFGRLTYNLNDRYLAAVSLRRDGSSRFGPTNAWGTFPSVAVAWRLSQEPFLRNVAVLSDLKLRASWAKTGNQAFANYQQYTAYLAGNQQAQVQFGNVFVPSLRPSAVDPNIKWEQTAATNIGLDYGFSNQRFSGAIDIYSKKTSDLIFTVPAAAGTNFSNFVTTNIGSMKNTGVEFSLSARMLEGGSHRLSWTADFTAARNTNKLTSISANGAQQVLVGGVAGGVGTTIQVLEPGQPINSFFVCQQAYTNGKPVQGNYISQTTGNVVTSCGGSDLRAFHDPAPKWILGHSSYLTLGSLDMSFTLRAWLGNYVYNNVASNLGTYQEIRRGSPYNLNADVLNTGFTSPQYLSDYYVKSGSFLRMDNITLGYGFKYRGQTMRVFGTVQNAFTITGYKGVDPTAGLNGIDNNIYPRSRTVTGGLSVRF
jgi:iron complex outermembrane receptor protein